jgi:hypothetical protein
MSDIGVIKGGLLPLPDGATQREIIEALNMLGEVSLAGMSKEGTLASGKIYNSGTAADVTGLSVVMTPPVPVKIRVTLVLRFQATSFTAADKFTVLLKENGTTVETVNHAPVTAGEQVTLVAQYLSANCQPATSYAYTVNGQWSTWTGGTVGTVVAAGTTIHVASEPENQLLV